ncbi:uncharacterized protein BCR38DRAFT_480804 [Pseudomassariella vexata]|uniref:DUF4211 domain-containing protein n=1 Tax=Pseudomassariella vexata TaxID=1141098 RepID=A0A1Y2EDZ1_9PEZI|nr:uncharacterized protein BCR38DRAFT_480804 [Pseudomassariella vexata]ORY69627.1 hypothetical protein BCR38DRAFT_480804 [Pseudomassariella vexata]
MPAKRKRQTRLAFEPTGSSPPNQSLSRAKVRYTESRVTATRKKTRPASRLVGSSKKGQQTLDSLGKAGGKQKKATTMSSPPSSTNFMPKLQTNRQTVTTVGSSDESAVEDGAVEMEDSEDDDTTLPLIANEAKLPASAPPHSSQSVSTRLKRTVLEDDEEEEDEDDVPLAPNSLRRRRPAAVELGDSSDEDVSPAKRRRLVYHAAKKSSSVCSSQSSVSSNSQSSGRSGIASSGKPSGGKLSRREPPSSPIKRSQRVHRTEKQKKIELLRRRRAGEKNPKLTSSESSSDDDAPRGIYDTDSEDELEVLKEFDDEERDEPSANEPKQTPKKAPIKKTQNAVFGNEDESDIDDFVVEDEDGPIGAPALLDIPLEFTAQAHKPLKEQFPYIIEWLVHNKINPAFDRNDPIYSNAWRKLDFEVHGLASSKFASSAWKPEFYRTLNGRPKLEAYEMGAGDGEKYDTCQACGRSGHPATYKIIFEGNPYHKSTLVEVEQDTDDEDSGHESVDTQDNPLPPTGKEWVVGSVCCSNAETAHSLIHWKHALKEWVEERLESDGWMTAQKLKEREKMKAKKRRALANEIVDTWSEKGIVKALYADFKKTLEDARQKSTTGTRGRRYR